MLASKECIQPGYSTYNTIVRGLQISLRGLAIAERANCLWSDVGHGCFLCVRHTYCLLYVVVYSCNREKFSSALFERRFY